MNDFIKACHDHTVVTPDENEWIVILSTFSSANNSSSEFIGPNLPFQTLDAKLFFIEQFYDQIINDANRQDNNKLIYFMLWTIRLLLREREATEKLVTKNFIDYLVERSKENEDGDVRVEAIKCLINACHYTSELRTHLVQSGGLNAVLEHYDQLFLKEDPDTLARSFLSCRMLFYCTIDYANARKFLQENHELVRRILSFAKCQFNRFQDNEQKMSRYELLFYDAFKLVYNLSLHHEDDIKQSSLFYTKE